MKRKNEKSDNIWDKIINTLWYLLFGFVFGMLVLISVSIKGHCASSSGYPLPYYVDYYYNSYFNNFQVNMTGLPANFTTGVLYWFSDFHTNTPGTKQYANINVIYNVSDVTIQLRNHDLNADVDFSDFDFTTDYVVLSGQSAIHTFPMSRDTGTTTWVKAIGGSGTTSSAAILGRGTNINAGGFTNNVPYYLAEGSVFTLNDKIILTNGEPLPDQPVINYGHATPPNEFHNPYFNPNSHAQPPEEVPPQVTINNYTWNTYNPPSIDDTDIISTLKSLIYVVNYLLGWLKDNISGEFQNLLSNLKGFFDYIGQTIQYYGGLIIDNIQNLITTFYNNMVSLVEDIAEKVGYISEPFDSSALTDAFESMQIYDDYDRCGQLIDDSFGFFDDISEPTSFTISIDLRGISILHQNQILYFDLGWINSAKSIIRAFMWTVTTFGLLYTVIDSIPDYIQGQDE